MGIVVAVAMHLGCLSDELRPAVTYSFYLADAAAGGATMTSQVITGSLGEITMHLTGDNHRGQAALVVCLQVRIAAAMPPVGAIDKFGSAEASWHWVGFRLWVMRPRQSQVARRSSLPSNIHLS